MIGRGDGGDVKLTAWVKASMPVAAVKPAGMPSISSESLMERNGVTLLSTIAHFDVAALVGDDGKAGHFGRRARRGVDGDQGHLRFFRLVQTFVVLDFSAVAGDQRDAFGTVMHGATAQ